MEVTELCKKYNIKVEPLDANTYRVLTDREINLDYFMEDLGICSILINRDVKYKKIKGFSYKIGRLYAFTTLPIFNDIGINYRRKLKTINNKITTVPNRLTSDNCIGTIDGQMEWV